MLSCCEVYTEAIKLQKKIYEAVLNCYITVIQLFRGATISFYRKNRNPDLLLIRNSHPLFLTNPLDYYFWNEVKKGYSGHYAQSFE